MTPKKQNQSTIESMTTKLLFLDSYIFRCNTCIAKCQLGLSQIIDSNRFESIQVANRLIDSKLLNRFTETIHYFYLFNCIVARKC